MQTLDSIATQAERGEQLRISFRSHVAPDSIQERFEVYHAAHPEIYPLLVRLARDVKQRGFERYSMKAIFERARWHMNIEKGDRDFKLNNNYHAPYARLIMAQERDLAGFFETRERVSECH